MTLFCWFVAALGLKEPSQPGEIIPFLFHFNNSRFCSIYGFFTVVIVFWGDWHTPKCGIPAIG